LETSLRFYLTGRISVEAATLVDQARLPGAQGRLALVYLVVERHRPVPVDELAAAVWGPDLPGSWEIALRAIVSKLRGTLREVGADGALTSDGGCYQARLGNAWVDVEAARNALDRAEGALRRGDVAAAWSDSTVAAAITGRPLLPAEDLAWVDALRSDLHAVWVRANDVLAEAYIADGQHGVAAGVARGLVDAEPYRESGYRHLMRAHVAAGNRGEAVRVYAELRRRLIDELGVEPSPPTEAVYLQALRSRTSEEPPGT